MYTVVVTGVTVLEVPDNEPGIHEYVVAPEAVITEDCPLQILEGVAVSVIGKDGFTFRTTGTA